VKNNRRVLLWVLGIVSFVLMMFLVAELRNRKTFVSGVGGDGQLVLSDGRTIRLEGIRIKSAGEEGYEAGMFLLNEMLINKDVYLEEGGVSGYSVWIGCTGNIFGYSGCNKRLLVNEELVRAGVAEKMR